MERACISVADIAVGYGEQSGWAEQLQRKQEINATIHHTVFLLQFKGIFNFINIMMKLLHFQTRVRTVTVLTAFIKCFVNTNVRIYNLQFLLCSYLFLIPFLCVNMGRNFS